MAREKNSLDMLKCIATMLVVLGHITILFRGGHRANALLAKVTDVIYLFHMPLFIAISGYVYGVCRQKGKYEEFVPFIKNKSLRLLVPYLFAGIVVLYPVMAALGKCDWSISTLCDNILLGHDCRHLWYLLALLQMFVIVWVLRKWLRFDKWYGYAILLVSIIVGAAYGIYCDENIFCVNMLPFNLPFFILGMWLSNRESGVVKTLGGCMVVGTLLAVGIKLCDVAVLDNALNIMLKGVMVVAIFALSKFIPAEAFFKIPLMDALSRDSYDIYLFHVPVIYICISIMGSVPWYMFVPAVFIIAIFVSVAICWVLRKVKLNALIGE